MTAKLYISALAHYHPDFILSNGVFEKSMNTSNDWIIEKLGIRERRFMGDYEGPAAVFELGRRVVEKVRAQNASLFSNIDYILSCGSMDDYNYPSTANLISEHFKISAPCLHLKAACASFVYAVQVGSALMASGAAKTILIVNSEPFTRQVDYGDRSSAVLFGDAATACILTFKDGDFEILATETGGLGLPLVKASRVSESSHISVSDFYRGKMPFGVPEVNRRKRMEVKKFEQNGKEVKDFVLTKIPKIIDDFLLKNNLTTELVEWFILHQANLRMMEDLCERLDIAPDKHLFNIDRFGNTSSAGAPAVLSESNQNKLFKKSERILMSTFGAGMCWGTLLLKSSN